MELSLLRPSPSTSVRTLQPPPSSSAAPRLRAPRKLHSCRRIPLTVRSAASEAAAEPDVFGGTKELTGLQEMVGKLPPAVRLAGSAVVVVSALAAGYGLGMRLGGKKAVGIGGAVVLGAASGTAAYALHSAAPGAAAASLHNLVAGYDDPTALRRDEVEAVANKYGVNKDDADFSAELCDLYNRYLESVIPPGAENLQGDEVEKIIKFKNGLGIDDPEAASVHMELGRHIFRKRLETGDREADMEQRRAFQKLIYVSYLVFGEASKFLLPWKRIFKISDSQVELAIRDNAQRLYSFRLNSVTRDIDEKVLLTLREYQLLYKLSDEIAAEMFRERLRKLVEENISAALDALKSRAKTSRGLDRVSEELEKVLAFNYLLTRLSQHSEAGSFAVGVGPISLIGGQYDGDRKIDDLKLLYRAYATESFVSGRLEDDKILSLNHLKNIFGLGKREAEAIMDDVTTKVYKKRLSQSVSGGEIDVATSKAAYLQNLCDELHFSPQKASKIHEEIYRQKLQNCLADGVLSQDDVAALLRLRVMLCIPQETIDAASADICGSLFKKVVEDAIESGVDGYEQDTRIAVRKAVEDLRLTRDVAMAVASKAVRKIFLTHVQRSKSLRNRTEAAKELKRMIIFNTLVATKLVEDIKGEPMKSYDQIKDEMWLKHVAQRGQEQDPDVSEEKWKQLLFLDKPKAAIELEGRLQKSIQLEITLKDDLPDRDRIDLYRTYLMFCLGGEATLTPFGLQLTNEIDGSELVYLDQLGQMLGLSSQETEEVRRTVAEQSFTKRAEVILADGQLTKSKIEQLNEVQNQVGLEAEHAQKIIRNITTSKMASAVETAVGQGRLSIKQVRELKEVGVDLEKILSLRLRESLFKKTLDEIFSSGTGEFDEDEVYEKMPKDLFLDVENAKVIVQEIAKNRISSSLVQAVALLRQRNQEKTVSLVNNMLACDKAFPSEPLPWTSSEELGYLYSAYLKSIPKPENLSRLQYLLGISDSTASSLRDSAERGELPTLATLADEEEEFVF